MGTLVDNYGFPYSGTSADRPGAASSAHVAAPQEGVYYYDTTIGQLLIYDGTVWRAAASPITVTYDFDVDGGAQGTIALGPVFPIGTIIQSGVLEVVTGLTGATATVGVQIQAADDIIADAAISGAPWVSAGLADIVPVGTAATMKQVATTAKQVSVVITTADLTAGKFHVHLNYSIAL